MIAKKELAATRDGFGLGLIEAAQNNPNIYAVCADLTESMRLDKFEKLFPNQFVQVGVAEQNMVGVAAGLALAGKTAFAASFAVFSPGRSWDQVRVSVAYSNLDVKLIGGHAGLATGPDGATHQALEDIAMMRVLPNMIVIVPCDAQQAREATLALAKQPGPAYLRLSRPRLPVLQHRQPFQLGKAEVLEIGNDLTIIVCGDLTHTALNAAKELKQYGFSTEVINLHTIKPLDHKTIVKSVNKTKRVITLEDHQVTGGMGSAIAELVAKELNRSISPEIKISMIGIKDRFGESGSESDLYEKHFLKTPEIVKQMLDLIQ